MDLLNIQPHKVSKDLKYYSNWSSSTKKLVKI